MSPSQNKENPPLRTIVATSANAAAALAGVLVVATLVWEYRHHFATPIYDDIHDKLRLHASLGEVHQLLSFLVSLHNEHRIFTTRIITIIDEFAFSGQELFQVATNNLLQGLAAIMVYRYAFAPTAGNEPPQAPPPGHRLCLFALSVLLFINPNFLYTLVVPFQIQHTIMAVLLLLAAAIISRDLSPDKRVRDLAPYWISLLVLAVLGTFTLGNAPIILLSAAAAAIVLRCRLEVIVASGALALVHVGIVLKTTPAASAAAGQSIVKITKFALLYWGSPLFRYDPWPGNFVTWSWPVYSAAILGALVFGVAVTFAVARFLKPGLGGRVALYGFVILAAIVATGLAAALSRAQYGVLEAGNKKYASFAILGWIGALAVLLGVLREQRWDYRRWEQAGATAILAAIVTLSGVAYGRETRIWQKMIDLNWEAGLAGFLKINDREHLHYIYWDDAGIREYFDYIERNNQGLYAHFPFRWGDDAQAFLASRREVICRGGVQSLDAVPMAERALVFDAPGEPITVSGWAWMTEEHAPPAMVLVVDHQNRIIGAAIMSRTAPLAEDYMGQKFDENLGWRGFGRATDFSGFTFFAVSGDSKRFCNLGGPGAVR
ncbi:hypothetical protein [Nitrospirillum viridazoti]|uniref:Uncharacterized protein n=1 Tax=Nitrospirillum amazonense TaxID=28077 RepID=A0A560IBH5_9PROT|nr:hypothetical protein [Nitrospirillum amazonense]TWB56396.1 hypothetical protein FBZ92_1111 [Nitrospirillum amazonense]